MNIFIESLFPRWTSNQTLFPQKMKPVVANCAVLKFPIHLSNRKMFEHKKNDLLPRYLFIRRVIRYFIYSLFMIGFALLIGISGYHLFADLDWINSFYNASMILTGMGPVAEMSSIGAKFLCIIQRHCLLKYHCGLFCSDCTPDLTHLSHRK